MTEKTEGSLSSRQLKTRALNMAAYFDDEDLRSHDAAIAKLLRDLVARIDSLEEHLLERHSCEIALEDPDYGI